jgi:hypothetical protein
MTDSNRTHEPEPRRPRRTQRRAAAIIAQYIHELSGQGEDATSADVDVGVARERG